MPKLLLIAVVIAVVLYIFRRMKVAKDGGAGSAGQNAPRNGKQVEDMVQCRSCGAYFPANTTCTCSRG